MKTLLFLCLSTASLAVPATPSKTRTAGTLWTGKTIMLRTAVVITQTNAEGEREEIADLHHMAYRVLEESDGRLRVRQGAAEGWFEKAQAVLLEDAPSFFSSQIAEDPEDSQHYAQRGTAYQLLGKLKEAIGDYDKAIELNPASAWYNNRGIVHLRMESPDKALADFSEAIRLSPESPSAWVNRSSVHARKKNYGEALTDVEEAIRLDPENPMPYLARAHLYDRQRRQGEALADFAHVLKGDPSNISALNGRAWILATSPMPKLRDGKLAVELATKACELSSWKDGSVIDTLAAAHAEAGDFARAIEMQERAIRDEDFSMRAENRARARLHLYQKRLPYRESTQPEE